jgi:hypothetical protein
MDIARPKPKFETGVHFCIRGDNLRTQVISDLLGVKPTWAFERGDRFVGREIIVANEVGDIERATADCGLWHLFSTDFIKSDSVDEHAICLLEMLEPAKEEIKKLIADPNYGVILGIWYFGPTGFSVSGNVMTRLAMLCGRMDITCWETNEDDEEKKRIS